MRRKDASARIQRIKGEYSGKGLRFGIVVSDFNEYLTRQLCDGAVDTLLRHGAAPKSVRIAHVPGAFEIPLAAAKLIRSFKPHAVVTLAVVMRGKTRHFDQVVDQTAKGVRELAMKTGVPVILGMVSAEKVEDAIARVGVKHMNKGREWALSALEMANLSRKLDA